MKKLHKLVAKSYLSPLVLTFFIALFILLMQFVWKYVDDLVGKGLEWYVIAESLFYASASFVPMALPLAILLSSIMSFGNFGEHSELTACKASGISLQRVMRPLIVVSILLSGVAFYFSNVVLPVANLKFGSLLYDVRQQRPAFALKAGMFYTGLEGYSIKVESIDKDGKTLNNILIYDHTDNLGNIKMIYAKSGYMSMSNDNAMIFSLSDGNMYEEVQNKTSDATRPFQRTSFKESKRRFDMSSYKFNRSDEEMFKDNYQMLNLTQLVQIEDTTNREIEEENVRFTETLKRLSFSFADTTFKPAASLTPVAVTRALTEASFLPNFSNADQVLLLENALTMARNSKQLVFAHSEDLDYRNRSLIKYNIEWHRKFTLSIACLILFFIGAPLGAIIRKGGLGLPVFMATVFFVIYHLISITGEKFASQGVISVGTGMWMASLVMLPLGLFFTLKATSDSSMFDFGTYLNALKRPFTRLKTK